MGNYNFVSMGDGALTVNGVDVGYLYGDVKYSFNYTIEKFKTGIPLVLRGQQAKEVTAQITAPLAELSPANVAMALGGLTIVSNAGTPVNVGTPTMVSKTFATGYAGHGLEIIALDGSTIASMVVKNVAETTTYANNTDYLIDSTLGVLIRNPASAIPSGGTVHISYTYTPSVSSQVNLGATFALAQVPVHFTHTRPNTGKNVEVHMWLASVDGKLDLNFSRDKWIVNDVTIEAVADTTGHAANPLGYILMQT